MSLFFFIFTFVSIITIIKKSESVPPPYCTANLNTSNCGRAPTPVVHYYKPSSLCEIALWRGCPSLNKFDNVYECSNLCIGKLWAKKKKPRDDKCKDKKKGDIGDDKSKDKKKGDIGDDKSKDKKKGDIEFVTPDDRYYFKYFPFSKKYVSFEVKAPYDAHIVFTKERNLRVPYYRVIIGAGRGEHIKSLLINNDAKMATETAIGFLDAGEFRGFWIRLDSGNVSVGHKCEVKPFLSWQDPKPFQVKYVGFGTGWGATGSWKIVKGVD